MDNYVYGIIAFSMYVALIWVGVRMIRKTDRK
jgi:hypothetical protein